MSESQSQNNQNAPDASSDFAGNRNDTSRRAAGSDDSRRRLSVPPPPPPRQRPWMLLAVGVAIAVVLFVVVMNIRTGVEDQTGPARAQGDDIPELLPHRLTPEQLAEGGSGMDDPQLKLEAGGWIQVPHPDNPHQLAQRYRCGHLDPNPEGMGPGWVEMRQPHAEMFLSRDRVVTMSGDSALVYLNNRLLESGRLVGDVEIRLYETGRVEDIEAGRLEPRLVIHTDDAELDNFLGVVRCRGEIFVSTASMDFSGRDLTMRLNDQENRIESLTVDHLDTIRLVASAYGNEHENEMQAAGGQPGQFNRFANDSRVFSIESRIDDVQFYTLMLDDDVRITQGDDVTGRQAYADELRMVFSLRSSEVGTMMARRNGLIPGFIARDVQRISTRDEFNTTAARQRPAIPLRSVGAFSLLGSVGAGMVDPVREFSATARRGSLPSATARRGSRLSATTRYERQTSSPPHDPRSIALPPSPDDVYVTNRGRMRMTPLDDRESRPSHADDVHLDLIGTPLRLYDYGSGAKAVCAKARYETGSETIAMWRQPEEKLRIDSPQFTLWADHIELRQLESRAEFNGPGEMVFHGESDRPPFAGNGPMSFFPAVAAAFTAVPNIVIQPPDYDAPVEQLRITWEGGVNIEFDSDDVEPNAQRRNTRIRHARFREDVRVHSPDFTLNSDEMNVAFRTDSDRTDDIRSIVATGNVSGRSTADEGDLSCDELHLDLETDLLGRTAPTRMLALGMVEAGDVEQRIWTERLDVYFMVAEPEEDEAGDDARAQDDDERGPFGSVRVQRAIAENGVQARLADGERIFADRMEADALEETVELTGPDVRLYIDNMLIDRGTHLVLRQRDKQAEINSPGMFRMYDRSIQPTETGPVEPPTVDLRPTARAIWNESLRLDELANDGGGAILLRGDVEVISEQRDEDAALLERRRVVGQALDIDMMRYETITPQRDDQPRDDESPDARPEGAGSPPALPIMEKRRRVRHFLARGDARIDALTYQSAAQATDAGVEDSLRSAEPQDDDPQIVSISGQHIEHDALTHESRVIGDGRLLIHDPRELADDEAQHFAGRGTTRFLWRRSLHLTRELDTLYNVVLDGDVRMEHRALDGAVTTLTCQELEASIVQDEAAADERELIAFSGSSRLRRLTARRHVFIRSTEYDIDCDLFDYNVATARAQLSARPGGVMSIHFRGTARTVNPQRAEWFMDETNRLIIEGARGGIGR